MPARSIRTLAVGNREEWRQWLEEHGEASAEIWLVFPKRHTGQTTLSYNDAVEEALCFGWIDSLIKRLDDDRYARKFTPRKAGSRWSTANRRRYADLAARGLLATAGLKRAPTDRDGDRPAPARPTLPSAMEAALKANPKAWRNFQQLAPSYRRDFIGWINSAKRRETRERRLAEAMALLAAGRKLGMK